METEVEIRRRVSDAQEIAVRRAVREQTVFALREAKVKLFAVYRELLGQSEMQREIADGTTIADLFRQVAGDKADSRLQAATLFALNETYVPEDTVVSDGDRVAFIPPVAGG